MENNIHVKQRDVIIHPCPNLSDGLVKPPLNLGHRQIIASNKMVCVMTYTYYNLT